MPEEVDRTTTGVFGLDTSLKGGYPKGKVIVEGPTSDERHSFALSFAAEGLRRKEHVMIVTSTISPTKVRMILRKLGVDVKVHEREGRLVIIDWFSHRSVTVAEIEEIGSVIKCPGDTLNLNEAFHKAYSKFPRDAPHRAIIEGISYIIGRHNVDTALLLANSINSTFGDDESTVLFVVDSEMHDSSTISDLEKGFDGRVKLKRIKGEGAVVGELSILSMRDTDITKGNLLLERSDDDTLRIEGSGARLERTYTEKEISDLMDSLQEDSNNEITWFGLGAHYASEKDYDKAHECFDAALKIRPSYVAPWIAKANLHIEQGQNAEALRCYKNALNPSSDEDDGAPESEELDVDGDVSTETICSECGATISAGDPFCLSCGADKPLEESKKEKSLEEALIRCEKRIKQNPEDAGAWFVKGLCLARMEQYEEAVVALNEATRLNFEYPGLWIVKAKVYSQLGDEKKATLALQRAIEYARKDVDSTGPTFECSICGKDVNVKEEKCPNCGARFKGLDDASEFAEEDAPSLDGDLESILSKWESELTEMLDTKREIKPKMETRPEVQVVKKREVRRRKGLTNGLAKDELRAKLSRAIGLTEDKGRTNGLRKGRRGRTNGLTNGVRGRTNGLTNGVRGRTNGLTNGVKGRTNGLTNGVRGRTNGLTNGVRGRTNGLTNGVKGRTNGLTNGVRGRTNGLTNGVRGRTNGLTNGLTNGVRGRTNGLTNGVRGRTNGLTNGLRTEVEETETGRINGLGRTMGVTNGLSQDVPGLRVSLADGLTNGNGLTNGLGVGRFGRETMLAKWKVYLVPLIAFVLMLVPLFYVSSPISDDRIKIDGDFEDWQNMRVTSMNPSGLNPNVDIVGATIEMSRSSIYFYLEVLGSMLQGNTLLDLGDVVHILIDSDRDGQTGYEMNGLGADHCIEVSGVDTSVSASRLLEFPLASDRSDWNAWEIVSNVRSATSSGELEVQVSKGLLGEDVDSVLAQFHMLSWDEEEDFSDLVLSETGGVLNVLQRSAIITQTVSGTDQSLLNLELTAINDRISLTSLDVEVSGSVLTSEINSLELVDSSDQVLDQALFSGNPARFEFDPVTIEEGESTTLTVRADITGGSGKTIGATVASLSSFGVGNDAVTLAYISSTYDMGYVDNAPSQATIDGGFADWNNCSNVDETGEASIQGDYDIDIMCFSSLVGQGNLFTYFDVTGRMLAGTDVPRHSPAIRRQSPSSFVDSDKDTVPNQYDTYPYDYNNDGTPDAQTSNDVDSDMVTDYPFGSDYWLNTTIPQSYPSPYAGMNVTRYIGPVEKPTVIGEDVARIYIDADNSTSTGYSVQGTGADYVLEIRGINGRLLYAGLTEFSGGNPGEWQWSSFIADVDVAFDSRRLEASVDASGLQLQPGYSLTFVTGNWKGGSDFTDGTSSRAIPSYGTRHFADANGGYGLAAPDGGTIDITIDGTIDEASETDWTTTAKTDTYGSNIKTYVVYNATDLFVAIEMLSKTKDMGAAEDFAQIMFDTNHDDGANPGTDDYKFTITSTDQSPTLSDAKGDGSVWDGTWSSSGWTGSADDSDTNVIFEFRIPLQYAFGTSTPSNGDIAGFCVQVYDANDTYYYYWPDDSNNNVPSGQEDDPGNWGDLFYTKPRLVVNEISPLTATEWVELYNGGDSIDINGVVLSDQDGFTWTKSSSLVVPNGVYLILMSGSGTDDTDFSDGNGTLYIGTTEFTDAGDDVLLKYGGNDMGFDCMQYGTGGDIQSCPSDAASENSWSGTLTAPSGTDTAGRDKTSSDTNDATDWDNTGGPDVSQTTRGHVNYLASLTVTGVDEAPSSVVQGENPVVMLKLTLSADYGWIEVTGLDVNRTGTSTTESDVSEATIWEDVDGDGEFDSGTDTFMVSGSYSGGNYTFSGLNMYVQNGNARNIIVVYNISTTSNTGVTVGARIDGEANVTIPVFDIVASFSAIQSTNSTIDGNELLVYGGDITPSFAFGSEDFAEVLNLTLTTEYASSTVTQIDVTLTGTGSQADIDTAILYDDVNGDADYDAGTDTFLATGTYSSGVYSFSSLSIPVSAGTDEYLLVMYNISATATWGNTVGAKINDGNDITVQSPDTVGTVSEIPSSNFPIKYSDIFVIEVTGEVYESTDGGLTFTNPGDVGASFVAICANKTNSDLYAFTADGLVYLSEDKGQTWTLRGDAFSPPNDGFDMTIDNNDDIFLLRSSGVVLSSTDGGATFNTLGDSGTNTIGIEANYSNNDLYVVNNVGGVSYSSDGGSTWTSRGDASIGTDVKDIAIDTAGYIYVLEASGEVFRSTDYGETFSQLSDIGTSSYIGLTIDFSYNYIYVVADDGSVYLSINRGTSWVLRSDIGTQLDYEDIACIIIPEFQQTSLILLGVLAILVPSRIVTKRRGESKSSSSS